MTKSQLIDKLKKELSGLPGDEVESRIAFYSEMIEDRMEEGLSEEDAVSAIGNINEIVAQIKAEYSTDCEIVPKKTEEQSHKNSNNNKTKVWTTILIILGSPIWLSLGIAAFAVLISVYSAIWAIAGSLWAVPTSLAGVSVGGLILGIAGICHGTTLYGITLIGAALVTSGLTIFAGFGCFHLTRLAVFLSKVIVKGVIRLFTRKENRNA